MKMMRHEPLEGATRPFIGPPLPMAEVVNAMRRVKATLKHAISRSLSPVLRTNEWVYLAYALLE